MLCVVPPTCNAVFIQKIVKQEDGTGPPRSSANVAPVLLLLSSCTKYNADALLIGSLAMQPSNCSMQ